MREYPELAATAEGAAESRLLGLDPIRVLLIGSGLAVGYGVRTQEHALTGALARAVQDGSSRGVITLNHSAPMRTLEQAAVSLGLVGATSFDLIVWCPSLFDVMRTPNKGAYRRTLVNGLNLIRETARTGAQVIVCELPVPTDSGPAEAIARTLVPRFNAALHRVVAPLPGVTIAATPPFTTLRDPQAFTADYYDRWAQAITHPKTTKATLAS
jgi:hypothetical protein